MNRPVILDLCGGTGSWSKPYAEAGYCVHNITLPHYDVRKVVLEPLSITFLAQAAASNAPNAITEDIVVPISRIRGILAAPPCTEFSIASNSRLQARPNWRQAMEIVEACERIIRFAKAEGYLKWWALENPRGFLRQFLGKPHYTFEQWQFGFHGVKPTDIWGYFKIPTPLVRQRPSDIDIVHRGTAQRMWNPVAPEEFEHFNLNRWNMADRAAIRAITPPGFAQQFFKVNR